MYRDSPNTILPYYLISSRSKHWIGTTRKGRTMPRAKKPNYTSDFSKGLKNETEMDLELEDEANGERSASSSPRNQSKLVFHLHEIVPIKLKSICPGTLHTYVKCKL